MSNVFVFRRPPHGVITEYFGGGKGGSTTTTNNVTQIPPEVLARYNAVNARAETVAQAPYQSYSQDPNAFVAPLSQTQQAGIQNTNAMAGAAQPYYGAATGLAAQSTGSVNPSALNVGQYMNPYTQSVVNATQAAMNQQQGQQLSQQQADAIRGGAFGGDRANLQRAQLMGQQGLAQAQAIAPLYQQNYNQALAAAQQQQGVGLGAEQANRQNLQNAATLFGSIGTNAQQAGLAGAQAQLAAGQTQQQTQQAGLQALYNQFQQQQGFPYQQAQFLANIAEGTGALSGNATSGTSTTTGGGGFFSDERLKENIQRVGETDDGQPIYRYNYKGDKNTQIGLLAQDVEKHHPEAVGLAGGYKTVNYKKATEDAVHKADGGSATDAYSIGAPSAMLQENSGKGLGAVPSLPQMVGGRDIPIEAGANAAGLAAMRSPAVTGFAPGVREGKQAELASLQSTLANPGPNANQLGSGPDYLQNRIGTLQDWLSKNNSQGGLVNGPGNFAQGGLAGGYADGGYMNPALAYYSPQQGQQDLIKLQPAGQHGILQGQQMQAPQRKPEPNPIAEANQMASLALSGGKIYDWAKKPSTSGYSNEFIPGGDNKDAIIDLNTNPDVESIADLARGGVAGGRHPFKGDGYVNPYGGLGGNDILGPIIEQQDTSLRIPGDKGTPAPSSKPQQSGGLGELAQAASMGEKAYKGANWAAGKLGLGEASPTAMSATSTEALPGVAGGVVPEAVAPVVPEAVTAAAPEALTAGLAGAETVAAPVAMAAAEGAADLAPLLFFLKNGGAVPRKHFADGGSDDDTTDQTSSSILPEGFGDAANKTLSSSDFWVPAVAGLGAMLASPNKRFLGAVGSGLVGGAEAYKGQQQLALNQQKNALETAKYMATSFTKFVDPDTQEIKWRGPNGVISDAQHNALLGQAATTFGQPGISGAASNVAGVLKGAPKPSAPQINVPVVNKELETTTVPGGKPAATAVETAKNVVPIAAPIPTQRAAPNVREAPAPAPSVVVPPPAAATGSAAAAAPTITGEEMIANANDRPTELKARVGNLTQAIAKSQSEGVAATDLITQRQQLQDRADGIINGAIIPLDKHGQAVTTFKDAANQRAQDALLTDAIGKNKGEYYKNASAFLENYPQDKQLIKSMATVYRSINMNRATGNMADAVGYLRSIPGLSALIPESLATMQGGYDEAMKNGVMQAFGQMASAQGEKAPKAIMSEALQTIATPSKAPESRMTLLAQKSGQMDRQNDMYSDWIAANKPDPAQFAISWNKDPAHDPEKYIEKAQKEIGVFKGAAPLAGNPEPKSAASKSISQVGEPSQVNAQAFRDYIAKYPSKKADAIAIFDKGHYPGAANKILGVQ